jgi:GPH family glycoside/pentoside/hexuronide:cation symporter
MWPVIILVAIAQFGYGVTYSVSSAMYADVSVYNEWKTGKNASGWIMGLINIPLKAGSTIRSFIIAAALAGAGFSPTIAAGKASLAVKVAISDTIMTIPGAILVAAAIVLLIGYKLDKTKLLQMQKEIDERRASEDAKG